MQTSGFKIHLIPVLQGKLQSPGKSILKQTKQINIQSHVYSVKNYFLNVCHTPRTIGSRLDIEYPLEASLG